VAFAVLAFLRKAPLDFAALRRLDIVTLVLFAVFLAGLQWLLHEGPVHHWRGTPIWGLAAGVGLACIWGIKRALSVSHPFVDLKRFGHRRFAAGCGLSFVLGLGLYGSVYLLSLFLGVVRGHAPLAIGMVLVVSGGAQLLTAPVAAWAETRADARLLTGFGFALFGAGLIANGFTTIRSDFDALFWPQTLRGLAMMFCLLPATRLALDGWPQTDVAEASGLFNLMRNLGGAIGIAGIDTLLTERTPGHVAALVARLEAGDPAAAALAGLPTRLFHNQPMGPVDPVTQSLLEPMVRRAAFTQSCNEAWWVLGGLFLLALLLLPAMTGKDQALTSST
jgi:DHA2 family multidrug resistance protein